MSCGTTRSLASHASKTLAPARLFCSPTRRGWRAALPPTASRPQAAGRCTYPSRRQADGVTTSTRWCSTGGSCAPRPFLSRRGARGRQRRFPQSLSDMSCVVYCCHGRWQAARAASLFENGYVGGALMTASYSRSPDYGDGGSPSGTLSFPHGCKRGNSSEQRLRLELHHECQMHTQFHLGKILGTSGVIVIKYG